MKINLWKPIFLKNVARRRTLEVLVLSLSSYNFHITDCLYVVLNYEINMFKLKMLLFKKLMFIII